MSDYYFAYGSNMNPARVKLRKMEFHSVTSGVLRDYRMTFNKRSKLHPGAASANVVAEAGSYTEGVLYKLTHPDQILQMDPFEGYPKLYVRSVLPVHCGDVSVPAWVYIANPEHVVEGLKPNRWYLNHLLAGEAFLSADYHQQLQLVDCLPDTDVEPVR